MIKPKTEKYLLDRFNHLSQKAVDLKNKIDTAKTQFKKDYYSKKLTKVNKEAVDVLILINSSQQLSRTSITTDKETSVSENENVIKD